MPPQWSGSQSWTVADQEAGCAVARLELPAWKRCLDLFLVVLASPFALAIAVFAALWIRVASPGPVLYRQTRIGKGGKPFTIYKFRSMHLAASTSPHADHVENLIRGNAPMTKLDILGDPRLIRGASLLRSSGLDELPQLVNVLRGEMSLVGPRPCLPNEFRCYRASDLGRFAVEPGLTGLWQVRRTGSTTFRDMLAMDEQYAGSRSLWADLALLFQTPWALLAQSGDYRKSQRSSVGTSSQQSSPLYGGFRDVMASVPGSMDDHV